MELIESRFLEAANTLKVAKKSKIAADVAYKQATEEFKAAAKDMNIEVEIDPAF